MTFRPPNDIALMVDIAMLNADAYESPREMMIALVMAERRRCYDLARHVCENDFDGVTGSLDADIMEGKVRQPDTDALVEQTDFLGDEGRKLFAAKMLADDEKKQKVEKFWDKMPQPTGEKTSTIVFKR